MRIRRPAPGILIASDSTLRPRLVGTLLTGSGAALAYASARGYLAHSGTGVTLEVVSGVLLAISGLAIVRGIATQTLTFDRPSGLVCLTTRHMVGTTAVLHRLADVADVVLERHEVSDQHELYRAALVMRDGTHRQWGTYAASRGRPAHVGAVEVVREFLGTASSPTAPDGTPAFPRPLTSPTGWAALPSQRRGPAQGALTVALLVSAALLAAGAWLVWTQRHVLPSDRPARAVVRASDIAGRRSSGGSDAEGPVVSRAASGTTSGTTSAANRGARS